MLASARSAESGYREGIDTNQTEVFCLARYWQCRVEKGINLGENTLSLGFNIPANACSPARLSRLPRSSLQEGREGNYLHVVIPRKAGLPD